MDDYRQPDTPETANEVEMLLDQQAEKAEVTAQERNMEREIDERIVRGQVIGPQETLLAQLDGTRHEHKQCH